MLEPNPRKRALFQRLARKRPGLAALRALAPPQPNGAILDYSRRMSALWRAWEPIAMREAGARFDAELFTASFDELVSKSGLLEYLTKLGQRQSKDVGSYLQKLVRTPGAPADLEGMLDEFRKRNVALIKNVGADQSTRLRKVLAEAAASGQRHEALVETVQATLNVGKSRAMLIARDQVTKFNGTLQRAHQKAAGITRAKWLTSGDEDVRDSHAAMNGKEFEWDNPPIVDGEPTLPGEAIQCRCQAIPVIDLFADLGPPVRTQAQVPARVALTPAPKPASAKLSPEAMGGFGAQANAWNPERLVSVTKAYEGLLPDEVRAVATGKRPTNTGQTLPPIKVLIELGAEGDIQRRVIIDGNHRLISAKAAGATEILAEVTVEKRGPRGGQKQIQKYRGPIPI